MNGIQIDSVLIDDIFNNIPNNKIRIICLNTKERKIIHQYLDREYPNLNKTSLRLKCFNSERIHTFIRCYECDYKSVPIDNYHCGFLDNNIDEWRSGDCPKCRAHISFEPNYDNWDDVRIVWKNNMPNRVIFLKKK
jgi:hypothetical protein